MLRIGKPEKPVRNGLEKPPKPEKKKKPIDKSRMVTVPHNFCK